MERPSKNKIEQKNSEKEYSDLIDAYQIRMEEIKRLERKTPHGVVGDEVATSIRVIDQERHDTHLKLIELGKKLGKDKNDVLIDIIRRERTLDEYGLPEFSILTENDIIDTGDWHDPFYFNVDPDTQHLIEGPMESYKINAGESTIKSDEVMLVFAIVPIDYGEDILPEDYEERIKRANALVSEVNGKIFEERDSDFHDGSVKILGVIIPKKDLEKIASIIRDNPDKYRLGKEFYSNSAE